MRPFTFSKFMMGGLAAAIAVASGCIQHQQQRAPEPRPEPVADCNYVPQVPAGMIVNSLAFPTGEPMTSAVMLHEVRPREARVGQNYPVEIHVTNRTRGRLQNVVVRGEGMQNLSIVNSNPNGNRTGEAMLWNLGDMGPCETKVVRVTAKADRVGVSADCLSVSYNNTLCAQTTIVEPALVVTKTQTPEANICERIEAVYEVRNTGTGIAENVRVRDTLPEGLTTEAGARSVELDAGTLAAGQAKTATVWLRAARTGRFESPASASAEGGLTAESARAATVVRQATITLTCNATNRAFLGRDISYEFVVKNTSDTVAEAVIVSATMPTGATFVSGTMGGGMSGNGVVWNVGNLAAGESKTVAFTVRPGMIGTFRSEATAVATCVQQVAANCQTDMQGIPAILVEVVDDPDPVQVNTETNYQIIVTNQGSATDSNIKVVCTLPDGLAFVSGGGASNATANGQTVTFATVPTLAPKASVTYTLRVRATKPAGDVRMLTDVSSDQFKQPIREMESTNLYQ